jgi:hypothetical protein
VKIRELDARLKKVKKGTKWYKKGWKNPYQKEGKQPASKVVKFKRKKR